MTQGHTNGMAGAMVTTAAPLAKAYPLVDQSRAFEPNGIDEAYRMAKLLVASRLLPEGCSTPEAAFAIIATGRELGMTAMQSLRSIHIIKGKPTLSADLVCALVKRHRDVCSYFQLVESTSERATYKAQRVGEPEPTTMSFTLDDAKRAQLLGNPSWAKFPAAMLRARCITALARAVFPDLVLGIYDPEELEAVAVPEERRVYVEPAPAQDGGEAFAELTERIDHAETAAELNLVAKDCMAARRAGHIHDAHVDTIAAAVKGKRALLGAPPPPKSEPRDYHPEDHDADPATENS